MNGALGAFRVVLLAGLALAVLVGSCRGETECLGTCDNGASFEFDSPIGQPGDYIFEINSATCSVRLPVRSSPCIDIRDYAVVGTSWAVSAPSGPIHVRVRKDGLEVINADATLRSSGQEVICGQTCIGKVYGMPIPPELVRPFYGPCSRSNFTGTYLVHESNQTGCASPFTSDTVALVDGLLQMDGTCQSTVTDGTTDACFVKTTTSCKSTGTWDLSLIDLLGDGSRLVGSWAPVASVAPCDRSADLDLLRQ